MISLPLSSNNPYLIRILSDHLLIISDSPDLPFILSNLMCYMHLPHFLLTSFICPTCVITHVPPCFTHAFPLHHPCLFHYCALTVHLMHSSCSTCVHLVFTLLLPYVYLMDTSI